MKKRHNKKSTGQKDFHVLNKIELLFCLTLEGLCYATVNTKIDKSF